MAQANIALVAVGIACFVMTFFLEKRDDSIKVLNDLDLPDNVEDFEAFLTTLQIERTSFHVSSWVRLYEDFKRHRNFTTIQESPLFQQALLKQ